jgi:hypothetical protein
MNLHSLAYITIQHFSKYAQLQLEQTEKTTAFVCELLDVYLHSCEPEQAFFSSVLFLMRYEVSDLSFQGILLVLQTTDAHYCLNPILTTTVVQNFQRKLVLFAQNLLNSPGTELLGSLSPQFLLRLRPWFGAEFDTFLSEFLTTRELLHTSLPVEIFESALPGRWFDVHWFDVSTCACMLDECSVFRVHRNARVIGRLGRFGHSTNATEYFLVNGRHVVTCRVRRVSKDMMITVRWFSPLIVDLVEVVRLDVPWWEFCRFMRAYPALPDHDEGAVVNAALRVLVGEEDRSSFAVSTGWLAVSRLTASQIQHFLSTVRLLLGPDLYHRYVDYQERKFRANVRDFPTGPSIVLGSLDVYQKVGESEQKIIFYSAVQPQFSFDFLSRMNLAFHSTPSHSTVTVDRPNHPATTHHLGPESSIEPASSKILATAAPTSDATTAQLFW